MDITPATVEREREWALGRAATVVPLVNRVRDELGDAFGVSLPSITKQDYAEAINAVFESEAKAVNVAALIALLRDLDVEGDYPGFVVDEYLGRELAGLIAGDQPLRMLAESTFHYADVTAQGGETAGADDLEAALAAGVQTRLPGWQWREDGFGGR